MEPMVMELGKTALEFAFKVAFGYNKLAKENKDNLLLATRNYLEAALAAIQGLENEYQEIITKTKYCNLADQGQVQSLKKRIRGYLKVHKLLPELETASIGLEDCKKRLRKESSKTFLRYRVQEERETAISNLEKLMDQLNEYLKELEGAGLRHREAGTGVGIKWLLRIQDHISSRIDVNQQSLGAIVEEAEQDSTNDHLIYYTRRIRTTIHEIQNAFE